VLRSKASGRQKQSHLNRGLHLFEYENRRPLLLPLLLSKIRTGLSTDNTFAMAERDRAAQTSWLPSAPSESYRFTHNKKLRSSDRGAEHALRLLTARNDKYRPSFVRTARLDWFTI
jgi:hypothetical protein